MIAIGGADYFNQENDFVSPPQLEYEPNDGQPGTVVLSKSSNLNLNLALNGNYTFLPEGQHFQATTSFGVQYEDRDLDATRVIGRTLLAGQENPDQAASLSVLQDDRPVRDLGLYAQEEVLLADRKLLLTAGIRADRSSANGDTDEFFFYPKAAVSYRFIKPFGSVEEIKLRGAFGQTGNQPLFGAKFSPDTTGTIGGLFGQLPGNRAGDPNIRPETQTEFEGGFDAQFANGRAELNFTVYQRTISDLLLERTLAPSSGQETRIFSSDSKLRNRGVEVALTLSPIQSKDVNWLFRTTFFANRSNVTQLDGPAFETGGFGTSLGAFFIEEGKSATQIIGTEGLVGDASPDFQMAFSSDIDVKRFTIGLLFDWKQGGDMVNLTEFLYDAGQNSIDYLDEGGGADRSGGFRGRHHEDLRAGWLVRQAARAQHLVQSAEFVHPERLRLERALRASHARRTQPAALHRLSRTGPRGEQLRQPGHRAKHRRGTVPAEPQLLLLSRPGVLTMTPITRRWYPVLLLGAMATGACSFDSSTNPNSPDPIGANPTRVEVGVAAAGMLIAFRTDFADIPLDIGIMGREVLRFDGSDPRFTGELLEGPLDPGGDAFGGDHWADEYAAIRQGNLILSVLPIGHRAQRRRTRRDGRLCKDDPGVELPAGAELTYAGFDSHRHGHLGDRGARSVSDQRGSVRARRESSGAGQGRPAGRWFRVPVLPAGRVRRIQGRRRPSSPSTARSWRGWKCTGPTTRGR